MNESAHNHYQRAVHLMEIYRWSEAVAEAGKCLSQAPHDYRALCLVSACYIGLKDYQRSLEFAEKAIAANPHNEWAFRLQSINYQRTKKPKKALKSAEECVRQAPEQIYCLETLASAQLELNKLKEARKTAETMRSLAPDAFESHQMLGYVALNASQIEEALVHFERALKISPDSAQALSDYAWALYAKAERLSGGKRKRDLLKNAIDVYELSLQVNPTSSATRDHLRRAIDLYSLTDTVSLITALSFILITGSLVVIHKLQLDVPAFLNIFKKPPELFIINSLALIELHLFGLIHGCNRAYRTLSPKSRFFIENEGKYAEAVPLLILYGVLLSIPLAVFGYRFASNGSGWLRELSVFDWATLGIAAAIFAYYLSYLFEKLKNSALWSRYAIKPEKE